LQIPPSIIITICVLSVTGNVLTLVKSFSEIVLIVRQLHF
jgi:hypothetical protein